MSGLLSSGTYPALPLFKGIENYSERYDVFEGETEYLITVDVPGVKRENISISLEKRILSIVAERTDSVDDYKRLTRDVWKPVRKTSLSFNIPFVASNEDIEASLDSGVLTVKVKKPAVEPPIKIEIK